MLAIYYLIELDWFERSFMQMLVIDFFCASDFFRSCISPFMPMYPSIGH